MSEEEHFQKLVALSEHEREAYLADLNDPELADRLRRLLFARSNGDSLLSAAEMESTSASFESMDVTTIGPYKLREPIGEGGMGTVYVAEQEKPVRRKVALKIIKAGMDTKDVIARFEAERQALALMDHPNIARVLDAGSTDTGRPYFVMELVRGIPLTEYCDQQRHSVRQRLRLFVKVCLAIQHAHQKGIIHRDIKPSNVLVTEHDGVPVPKVIDFGVAKAIGQKLTDKTVYTHHLQPVGTLQYMSPEQSRLSGLDVDTRSDVYSLGLLLYELLTGALPFDRETFNQASFDEKRRIIAEDEAPKPSTRVSTLGQSSTTVTKSRQSDLENLRRELRGEIDWILTKALEKDRNRRYESADRLAEDLQNYLDGDIVLARPPSAIYRLSKTWKRNKAATLMLGLLLIGLLGAAFGWYQSVRRAEEAQRRLNIVQDFAMVLAMRGDPRDTAIAVNVCKASGATEVWLEMLRAQSEMARQEKLPDAIKRLKRASDRYPGDTHHRSCLALLAYAYILDGDSDGSRETAQKLRDVEPRTTTEKFFFGNAFLSNPERCWELANQALRERDSILARFIRAKAAAMQAINANDLKILDTGVEDLDQVQKVVPETTEQVALRCHLYLAGQLILRHVDVSDHQSTKLDKWSRDGEDLVSRLEGMPESPPARYTRAWYRDILGTNEQARAAWMDVLENGSNGWLAYQAATILYTDNDVPSARKYLQGNNTMEQLALAAILSRNPAKHEDCIKIYENLKQRNSTAMFWGGFPLEILLDLGELGWLQTDALDLLNDGKRRSDFDQLMLSYFADPQKEMQVLAQLEQFNHLDRLQGHTLIGRHMMVEQPPRIDDAKKHFKKARQLGVFNSGDFFWAKAYLKALEDDGTVYVPNEAGKSGPEDPPQ